MPKITRRGGVSDAAASTVADPGVEQVDAGSADPVPVDDPAVDGLPKRNASKDEWVAAAVVRGWDREDAEAFTRDELVDELQ